MIISVIDYGLSNLRSVCSAISHLGSTPKLISSPEDIRKADALILPGVGAFSDGMEGLRKNGLDLAIREKTLSGTPLLGVCLGMQMLFDSSDEFGFHPGLGLIPGKVTRIPRSDSDGMVLSLPHISWEPLQIRSHGPGKYLSAPDILEGIAPEEEFYFIHSFYAIPEKEIYTVANTEYGGHPLCAVAAKDNVIGTQFHPEKSGEAGLKLLRNFIAFCENTTTGGRS